MNKILIVIPTYNEKQNVERLTARLLNMNALIEVLVVDDNSPDGTGDLVEQLSKKFSRIHLLRRAKKLGLGTAYIAGFQWALARDYVYIFEMDADLSHRPRYIPKFLKALKEYDLVIGSRWIPGGKLANWPWRRVFLSRLANIYSQFVLGVPIYDLTGGFIAYRRKVLETIGLDTIRCDGYSFQIEMKMRALEQGYKLKEIPITFTDRKAGDSKISRRIVWEAFWLVLKIKFQSIFEPSRALTPSPRELNN
ncbi:MAG: polyprenol monophosphomannose synthase [Candidatus Omnitrophica bacterium]|nr:polyprenol monophosphomannose synthase [Candidatus Omnitrophota bacterium]